MEIFKSALPWITVGLCVLVIIISHFRSRKGDKKDEGNYMSEGMCLGLCIGLAFGSEWMSLGMLIGLCLGMCIKK